MGSCLHSGALRPAALGIEGQAVWPKAGYLPFLSCRLDCKIELQWDEAKVLAGPLVSRTVMTVAPVPHWPPPRFHSSETVTDGQPHNFPDPRLRPTFTFREASALGLPASARTPCSGNEDHLLCIHVSESMLPGGALRNAGQGPQVPQTEPGRWRMCQNSVLTSCIWVQSCPKTLLCCAF